VAVEPGLSVVLAWDAPVDLDLYVTDPAWETVYFANNPSRSGGELLHDVKCRDVGNAGSTLHEVARFPAPQPGVYRVGVDFIDRCRSRAELASFRVAARSGTTTIAVTDTLRPEQFRSIVLEVDLSGPEGNGAPGTIRRLDRGSGSGAEGMAVSGFPSWFILMGPGPAAVRYDDDRRRAAGEGHSNTAPAAAR
jgi:hypothetical protein